MGKRIIRPHIVTESTVANPVHDFTINRVEWEQAVFENAAYFRIHVIIDMEGLNHHYHGEFESLQRVINIAKKCNEDRVLIYAISKEGRHTLLPPEKWDELLQQWKKRNEQSIR